MELSYLASLDSNQISRLVDQTPIGQLMKGVLISGSAPAPTLVVGASPVKTASSQLTQSASISCSKEYHVQVLLIWSSEIPAGADERCLGFRAGNGWDSFAI